MSISLWELCAKEATIKAAKTTVEAAIETAIKTAVETAYKDIL
jgi:hypothetical protein